MNFSFNRLVTFGLKKWVHHPSSAWLLSIVWLLLIGYLAFFWNLGSTGLLDETEPLFVEAARQMTVTGDWITPFFNEATRFDKPPLIYWLMAIAFHTFGVNEFAARLPSALAGLALTAFCFYTLRYFGSPQDWSRGAREHGSKGAGEKNLSHEFVIRSPEWRSWLVASLGAAMVALHPLTLFFGRIGYSDMLLSACMGGALLAFFLGYAQGEQGSKGAGEIYQSKITTSPSRWYLAFYVLIALAVLTKGPVGAVLPGLIIGSFLLYVGRAREVFREMRLVRGALIVLALSLPWFILVILRNGEAYIDSFFGYHNLERFTSVVNQHQGPWYFHILVVLIGFTPWSIALPAAIAHVQILQRRHWQKSARQAQLGLFALFWFLIVLGFFTLAATKYFSYTLPLMPAAAILVALWCGDQIVHAKSPSNKKAGEQGSRGAGEQGSRGAREQRGKGVGETFSAPVITSLLSIVLFLGLAGACFWCPHWLGNDSSMPNLGLRISQAGLPIIGATIWGVSAIALVVLLLQQKAYQLWFVSFIGFVAFWMFVILPAFGIVDTERQLPLRQIAQSVVQVSATGEKLVMVTDGFEKPSLVFYTKRPVTFLHDFSKALPQLQKAQQQSSSQSVLLISSRESLEKTGLTPNQYQEISQAGIYQLVRVSTGGL